MKTFRLVLSAIPFIFFRSIVALAQPLAGAHFFPQQFNPACGKETVECSEPINRCIQAAYGDSSRFGVCNLPAGRYLVKHKLLFCASISGDSSSGSIIIADKSFSGHFVLDFNCPHGGQNYIENLTVDVTRLGPHGEVTAFGSSSVGGGGGSSLGRYSDVTVRSSSRDTFAVSAHSSSAEPGMFSGSVWTNLVVAGPCNLEIGQNQDDGTMIGLRTLITGPCSHSGSGISISSNWKLIDSYVAVASSNGAAPVTCGTNTDLDGLFIEGVGVAPVTDPWLIQYDSGAQGPCIISRLNTNIALNSNSSDEAVIRVNVPLAPLKEQGVVLGTFAITSGGLPTHTLFSIFNSGTSPAAGPLTISVQGVGWDAFDGDFARIGTGSTPNPGNVLRLVGFFDNHSGVMNAAVPSAGEMPSWKSAAPVSEMGKL